MVSIILFSSCNLQKHTWNLYKETMAREYDWHDYPTELDKKPPNKNTFYFTLNYPACYGCPVIRYPLDGKNMLFLVDTGSSKNYITKTGLKCFFDSEEELENYMIRNFYLYKNGNENNYSGASKQLFNEFTKAIESGEYEPVFSSEDFYIDYTDAMYLYGTIGQEYLRKYDRVTFDFIENKIEFNGSPLINARTVEFKEEEYVIDRTRVSVYIPFEFNGIGEWGILDTGSPVFTPRNGFGKNNFDFDFTTSQDYSKYSTVRVKKRIPKINNYSGIKIGDNEYSMIKGLYSNIYGSGFNKGAQLKLQKICNLGCIFFYDHIIQIDYSEKVLRIK